MSSLPRVLHFLLVLFALAVCSRSAQAELIVNGGFEAPLVAPGTFTVIGVGSEPAGFAWEVFQGTVDLGNGPNAFVHFPPAEGQQGLDMAGNDNAGITQGFPTDVGQTYRLSFLYADNPLQGGDKTMDFAVQEGISLAFLLQGTVSHGTSTNGPPAASNGNLFEGTFVATSSFTRLSFLNTTPGGGNSAGILLDAVSVTAVPEPASVAIALCGAVALFGSRVIRRRAD